ncbi:MAG TPA: TRAP transporter substrate-binding protein [Alphaproteobacteria bacterium]|nr:TRAP transporter substrate-binding protein [Alphaproteobacteria bacterium]
MRARFSIAALLSLTCLAFAAVTASAQEIRLRAGHDQPVGSMYDEGHQMLRKLLDERSKGRIKMEVFPAAQLGSEVAMIEGVRLGSVDVSAAHVANASTVVPELALFSVSYLFKDRDHYERVVNDPKFRERIESLVASKNLGIKVIGYYAAGVRNVYTRRGPVATPDDLKGTKIRVMNNPVEAKIWNTLGAIPTPMNFGEVYQSLQSGVLDAAENAPAVIESNRHYEAAKTIILTEHQRSISLLLMNERKFSSLPADLKEVTLAAAREAAEHERKKDAEFNTQAVDRMKEKGAQIVTPDRAKFAERIAPIQDEVAANLKMTDVLQLIRSHEKK